MMQLMLQIAE